MKTKINSDVRSFQKNLHLFEEKTFHSFQLWSVLLLLCLQKINLALRKNKQADSMQLCFQSYGEQYFFPRKLCRLVFREENVGRGTQTRSPYKCDFCQSAFASLQVCSFERCICLHLAHLFEHVSMSAKGQTDRAMSQWTGLFVK